jgi:hypothetical protein
VKNRVHSLRNPGSEPSSAHASQIDLIHHRRKAGGVCGKKKTGGMGTHHACSLAPDFNATLPPILVNATLASNASALVGRHSGMRISNIQQRISNFQGKSRTVQAGFGMQGSGCAIVSRERGTAKPGDSAPWEHRAPARHNRRIRMTSDPSDRSPQLQNSTFKIQTSTF